LFDGEIVQYPSARSLFIFFCSHVPLGDRSENGRSVCRFSSSESVRFLIPSAAGSHVGTGAALQTQAAGASASTTRHTSEGK